MISLLRAKSQEFVRRLEGLFAWYGGFVASRPLTLMLTCVLVTGLVMIGLINYRTENNRYKLWIPDDSDFVKNFAWLEEHSPPDARFNSVLLTSDDNVLTPATLLHMLKIHEKVMNLVTKESNISWSMVCSKIPVSSGGGDNSGGQAPAGFKPWIDLYPDPWCSIVSNASSSACFERSILEVWGYDESTYTGMTQEQLLQDINQDTIISAVFRSPINVRDYLGTVSEDEDGRITGARAATIQWFGKINTSFIAADDVANQGTGEVVDPGSLEFEAGLRDLLLEDQKSLPPGVTSYINVARGFSDIAGDTISGDAVKMPIGFLIMFIYVQIMLGRFSWLEQRGILALAGLSCIALAIGFTYGFCSALGLFYGPLHGFVPFLLLGIGVDDMFVIMKCFDNLSAEEKNLHSVDDIPGAMSMTMRRAGVAITVTSLTDFMVFAIGGTTVLPALRSFCLWCGVGVLAVYFFQLTIFAGSLALDTRRLMQQRNGWCLCIKHKNTDIDSLLNNTSSTDSLSHRCFGFLADVILSVPGVVGVLTLSSVVLGVGIWQASLLRQEFQPIWFLPTNTYLRQYFEASSQYLESGGVRVTIYMAEIELHNNLEKIEELIAALEDADDIVESVDAWYPSFKNYSNSGKGYNVPFTLLDEDTFQQELTQFLHNTGPGSLGLRFIPSFSFSGNDKLECGAPAPPVFLSTISFTHNKFSGREEHVPALKKIKKIIQDVGFNDGLVFPFAQVSPSPCFIIH